jgi:hypothetical protein
MRQATSLFAVASHCPIDLNAIKSALQMEPLAADEAIKITLRVTQTREQMEKGKRYTVKVTLNNGSKRILSSHGPTPFHLSYHWENETSGSPLVFDGLRTQLVDCNH